MAKKTKKFKTEVQQLLDLVIHSLYSKKEIYLRELISNASDAIDRAQFEALTDKSITPPENWRIKIHVDKEARTITVSDNGIGMNSEEVERNIGTIANSGTRAFLENLQKAKDTTDAEFIGQFGVGFYASFMVADEVTVITKRAGKDQQAIQWSSKGAGSYSLEETDKEAHGTDIILYVKEGLNEFLEEWKIRQTVKEYSDYIKYPIVMDVTRKKKAEEEGDEEAEVTEEKTLNSMKAIWKKDKSEISDEEYNEFYKHVSHDYGEPLETIHYFAEGVTEFRALLYIPSRAPHDLYYPEGHKGIHLYVKNVFITDDCKELVPQYLRFINGVVDSSDLPLNVSREILQDDVIIRRIRKSIIGKILGALSGLMEKDSDKYLTFYTQFGNVIKEGLHSDFENKEKLRDLVLLHSTKSAEKPTSLKAYVERMPEDQKEIYYLTGENLETVKQSPHLEVFKSKDYEVLFFVDTIDEWALQGLDEYDGKPLKAVDRGDIDLATEEEKKEREEKQKTVTEEYKKLTEYIENQLKDEIKEVRLSNRLTDSACCLVADETGMNPNMERIIQSMGQEVSPSKRILELNPDHPVPERMKGLAEEEDQGGQLEEYVELLYNQALIAEGSAPKNPSRFTQLVSKLMAGTG